MKTLTPKNIMNQKKKIKAHKGGRSETVPIRATPEIKKTAQKLALKEGISIADLFEKWVIFFDKK